MSLKNWNSHYGNDRSRLTYPDENLVRMLSKYLATVSDRTSLRAADIGCGSGRHLKLLAEMGLIDIIGLDYSIGSLEISASMPHTLLLNADNETLPLKNGTIDIAVCWGSLHYSDKKSFERQLAEVHRVLAPDGMLFGTLRSDYDTHLKRGVEISDGVWRTELDSLNGAIASFYREDELVKAFSCFADFSYGIMERTIPGDRTTRISHWYYSARR